MTAFPATVIKPQGTTWFLRNLGLPGRDQTTILVPWLSGVGPYFTPRITCHRRVAPQLAAALSVLPKQWVLTYLGCYNFRRKRGGVSLSRHAWGAAIDFNAAWNGLGQEPADWNEKGTLKPIVGIMQAFGFCWGGHWRRPDGMHFEVVRLLSEHDITQVVHRAHGVEVAASSDSSPAVRRGAA